MAGDPPEIQTGYLPYKSLECYHYTSLLSDDNLNNPGTKQIAFTYHLPEMWSIFGVK
jgi:hypothetical protein